MIIIIIIIIIIITVIIWRNSYNIEYLHYYANCSNNSSMFNISLIQDEII